jgi:hypothetical protein
MQYTTVDFYEANRSNGALMDYPIWALDQTPSYREVRLAGLGGHRRRRR